MEKTSKYRQSASWPVFRCSSVHDRGQLPVAQIVIGVVDGVAGDHATLQPKGQLLELTDWLAVPRDPKVTWDDAEGRALHGPAIVL
eukprot:CAMPEP_0196738278 /NCGR_PEP_ID=MMETSP1091-20130531/15728_1 /TAXON_ID=302021 /ORGANISM="Rhodomonas sp., Strain CCMP768" /LENGTH=85 /DNA_ID=CAMNT_0042082239 /DNA_START=98 /DNA_END=352 /DNA_ORIENTATION=+